MMEIEAADLCRADPIQPWPSFYIEAIELINRVRKAQSVFDEDSSVAVGEWFVSKYRKQQVESGTQQAARNMRKQGCPIWMALMVLAGTS